MKKLVFLLFAAVLMLAGCADDIIITQRSELRGAYKGYYKIIENYETGGETHTEIQYIDWTFTDQKFFCEVNDTINAQWLCDCSGNYALENVLVFSDTLIGAQTCDRDRIPIGDFQLIKYNNSEGAIDSLEISQHDVDHTMLKFLMLHPTDE